MAGPNGFSSLTQGPQVTQSGTYTVIFSSPSNGCTSSANVQVSISPAFTFSITSIANCNGTWSIAPIFTGGTAPYTFTVAGNPQSLPPGTYTVTATEATGCTATSSITLTSLPVLSASIDQVINPTSGANGAIQITVTNGVAPLSFVWTNAAGQTVSTQEDPQGLPVGVYSVVITDGNGCQVQLTNIMLSTIGTDDLGILAAGLKIYPNPADSKINIQATWQSTSIANRRDI